MRVRYNSAYVSQTLSGTVATDSESYEFMNRVIHKLYEMGAPIVRESITAFPGGGLASFEGQTTETFNGGAGIYFYHNGNNNTFCYDGCGEQYVGEGEYPGNYFKSYNTISIQQGNKQIGIYIHSLRCEDCFYFGFGSAPNTACISSGIVPMVRMSETNKSLGYAMVETTHSIDGQTFWMFNTKPWVEGAYYGNSSYNAIFAQCTWAFPETDTGKIPLIPMYSGFEDIYYKNVYISPMTRGNAEEKAFETDKGVFLIACNSGNGINWSTMPFTQLAFDITESVYG